MNNLINKIKRQVNKENLDVALKVFSYTLQLAHTIAIVYDASQKDK